MRKEILENLLTAGRLMSNVCYNVSQHASEEPLDKGNKAIIESSYKQWDTAYSAYRSYLKNKIKKTEEAK